MTVDVASRTTAVPRRRKDLSVESLRGLAILLMVAGHVIGGGPESGLRVPADSGWLYYDVLLRDIRMPLFTVLSGFVYAYRPLRTKEGMPAFWNGKARRLLVPLVTVGTAVFLAQALAPVTNADPGLGELWRVYVFGHAHLWFVQAIFLIFVTVGVLDAWRVLDSVRRWAIATACSVGLYVVVHVPPSADVFSVDGALRLLPFFLLGYGLHRYSARLEVDRALTVCLAMFVLTFAVRVTLFPHVEEGPPSTRLLVCAVGVFGVSAMVIGRRYLFSPHLAWIGQFAFGIYLLHVFGSTAARAVLAMAGVESYWVQFLAGLVAAVALPVLFELTLGRRAAVSWAFLGQRPSKPARLKHLVMSSDIRPSLRVR